MVARLSLLIGVLHALLAAVSVAAKFITSSDGTQIWAESYGLPGPLKQPLVLIHGIGGTSLGFEDLVNDVRLRTYFYIVTYDLRGHGRSGKPTTAAAYASKVFADDFAAVSAAFNVKNPLVLGWSYGGTVFTDIHSHLPAGTTKGFISVNAIPYIGIPDMNTPYALTIVPGLFVQDDVQTHVRSKIAVIEAAVNDPSTMDFKSKMSSIGSAMIQPPEISSLLLSRPQDPSALFAAGKKGFPLLMIYGTNDKVIQNEVIVNVTAPHFTKLQVKKVNGGSHQVFFEHKDVFIKTVIDFYLGLAKLK